MSEYRFLGAFRFLLAALVMAQHFAANLGPEWMEMALQPYEVGSVAVLVFFALSGFVIFEAAETVYPSRPWAFLINRLLRIMPQFVAAVLLTIAVCALFSATGGLRLGRESAALGAHAFSIQNITANFLGFLPFKPVATHDFVVIAWAIRVEMLFYFVVFAALSLAPMVARRLGVGPGLVQTGGVVALCVVPVFVLALSGRAPQAFIYTPYFVFGAALYVAMSRGGLAPRLFLAGAGAAIVLHKLLEPARQVGLGFERASFAQFCLLAGLLALMAVLANLRLASGRAVDRALGDLTYPLYLTHVAVMIAALSLTQGYALAPLLLAIPAAVLVAEAMRRAVEPATARLRDWVRGARLEQLYRAKA